MLFESTAQKSSIMMLNTSAYMISVNKWLLKMAANSSVIQMVPVSEARKYKFIVVC